MPEIPVNITTFAGIAPKPYLRTTETGFLSELSGMIPSEDYLRVPSEYSSPLATPQTMVWPCDRLVPLGVSPLFLQSDAVSTIDMTTGALTELDVYQAATPASLYTMTDAEAYWSAAPWHGGYWLACNGAEILFKLPSNSAGKVYGTSSVTASCACFSGERLVLGGLTGSYFSGASWTAIFRAWQVYASEGVESYTGQSFGSGWIVWSEAAGGDFDHPFWLFLTALGVFGETAAAAALPAILTQIERGAIGMRQVSETSSVLAAVPHGDRLLVGATYETVLLSKKQTEVGVRFEDVTRQPVGLLGRSSIAETWPSAHFLASNGSLWEVSRDGEFNCKDFSDALDGLTSDTVLLWDALERSLFLSDGAAGYSLSKSGLAELQVFPISLLRYGATTYALTNDLEGMLTRSLSLVTTAETLDHSSMKTIRFVEIHGYGLSNVLIKAYCKTSLGSAWIDSGWKPTSPDGVAYVGISGVEFKIAVTASITSTSKLEGLFLRVYTADARAFRGPRPGERVQVQPTEA